MIKTIDPTEVKNILEQEILTSKWNKPFRFLPKELYDWALLSECTISDNKIEKWEDFEFGRIDFDENDFRDLVFNNEYAESTEVLFISGESLSKGKAFSFNLSDYEQFVTYYENIIVMSFFQPDDYIVYLREYKEVKIIRQDGKLVKINKVVSA
ncbi:hypothetical protein [Niastella yeongjuensis]|nr:hypothetical protein [Niastella yeongjuensis]